MAGTRNKGKIIDASWLSNNAVPSAKAQNAQWENVGKYPFYNVIKKFLRHSAILSLS